MSHYDIRDAASSPNPGYHLYKDDQRLDSGPWSTMLNKALELADDNDTLTSGTVKPYINQPVHEARKERIQEAKARGSQVSNKGVV
jgi:hypothetical protein